MNYRPGVVVGLLALVGLFTIGWNVGGPPVDGIMEARNLVTAREIADSGSWLIPTMNGNVRIEKPPLPTWAATAMGEIAGFRNLWALRFPTCVVAWLGALAVVLYTRRMGASPGFSMVGGLVLLSMFLYARHSRVATWDVPSHAFAMAGIAAFAETARTRRASWAVLCGLMFAAMFMSKGPVSLWAVVLPWAVGTAAVHRGVLRARRRDVAVVLAVLAIAAAAWPLYLYLQEPGQCAAVFSKETDAWANRHVRSAWAYAGFPVFTGAWFPLALAVLVSPIWFRDFFARREVRATLIWLCLAWLVIAVVPTKKERYLIPVLFPLAILIALWLEHDGHRSLKAAVKVMKIQVWFAGIGGFAAMAAVPIIYFMGMISAADALVTGLLVTGGLAGWFVARRMSSTLPAMACACTVLVAAGVMAAACQVKTDIEGLKKHIAPTGLEDIGRRGENASVPFFAQRSDDIYLVWTIGRPLLPFPADRAGLIETAVQFSAGHPGRKGRAVADGGEVLAGWLSEAPPESDPALLKLTGESVAVNSTERWDGWSGKTRLYCSRLLIRKPE